MKSYPVPVDSLGIVLTAALQLIGLNRVYPCSAAVLFVLLYFEKEMGRHEKEQRKTKSELLILKKQNDINIRIELFFLLFSATHIHEVNCFFKKINSSCSLLYPVIEECKKRKYRPFK